MWHNSHSEIYLSLKPAVPAAVTSTHHIFPFLHTETSAAGEDTPGTPTATAAPMNHSPGSQTGTSVLLLCPALQALPNFTADFFRTTSFLRTPP